MIQPSFADFDRFCLKGNLVPIFAEVSGDLDTPVSTFMKVDDKKHSFLLESVEGGERWARHSFLGSEPRVVIRSKETKPKSLRVEIERAFPE